MITHERITLQRCDYCDKPITHDRISHGNVTHTPISFTPVTGVFCSDKCRISAERHAGLRL